MTRKDAGQANPIMINSLITQMRFESYVWALIELKRVINQLMPEHLVIYL